jgi:hypothetical protein
MTKENLEIINTIVQVLIVIVLAYTGIKISGTLKEQRRLFNFQRYQVEVLTYLEIYGIIQRHHSEEITKLRRLVLTEFEDKAIIARQQGKYLRDTEPDLHLSVSTLINYYEGLGMFLQGGWDTFPPTVKKIMLDMLHNSVTQTWPLIETYRAIIHPAPPLDWLGSYRWLFGQCQDYERAISTG